MYGEGLEGKYKAGLMNLASTDIVGESMSALGSWATLGKWFVFLHFQHLTFAAIPPSRHANFPQFSSVI